MEFCDELTELDWVSFIQPPPTKSCTAEQVVRYLTRYLTGGPISDSRIMAADTQHVTFLAREGKRVGGEREQVPVTIPTLEFMRRWCEHIQPQQLTKTGYFGGWCSRKRTEYQATCRRLLGKVTGDEIDEDERAQAAGELPSPDGPDADSSVTSETGARLQCSACDGHSLRLVSQTPKPAWSRVLTHLDERCPEWYAETAYAEFCAYLESEYGISYEDWDLETRIESTMRRSPSSEPPAKLPQQLYLPGLCPERTYSLEYY